MKHLLEIDDKTPMGKSLLNIVDSLNEKKGIELLNINEVSDTILAKKIKKASKDKLATSTEKNNFIAYLSTK